MSATASNLAATVAWAGFGIAFVVGAVAQRTNFCTMGAVSDIVNMGSWGRMRMWLLAIAVAIAGAAALHANGSIDMAKSIYTRPGFAWLSYLLGGFIFGIGMTLGSGCGNKTLVRIGGGSLKSLVVLAFLGISAYMTIKGLFGVWRVTWLDPVAIDLAARGLPGQDLPRLFSAAFRLQGKGSHIWVAAMVVAFLLIFIFKDREFRRDFDHILGGVVVGAAVIAGWYVTGHIGFAENPDTLEMTYFGTNSRTIESLSFVAPAAYLLELLMLWSDKSLAVSFGVALGLGVIAGSAAYSLATRSFRWEGFASAEDTANHIVGGILMGFGGVLALGCTIGQGITGISTLALGSVLTTAAIVGGSWAAMKYQYWRLESSL
jgi:uncharacterized membrane protein YedE/YeeE